MSDFPKRLAYVDDDAALRDIMHIALERSGRDIVLVTCMSGKELVSRMREIHPDLVLLDLQMPDMSGPDTIQAIRKKPEFDDVRFVFVTGKKKLVMLDEYKNLGVIGVIYKPFETAKIADQIAELWQAEGTGNEESGEGGD